MATSSKRAYAIPRYTEIVQKPIGTAFISTESVKLVKLTGCDT